MTNIELIFLTRNAKSFVRSGPGEGKEVSDVLISKADIITRRIMSCISPEDPKVDMVCLIFILFGFYLVSTVHGIEVSADLVAAAA